MSQESSGEGNATEVDSRDKLIRAVSLNSQVIHEPPVPLPPPSHAPEDETQEADNQIVMHEPSVAALSTHNPSDLSLAPSEFSPNSLNPADESLAPTEFMPNPLNPADESLPATEFRPSVFSPVGESLAPSEISPNPLNPLHDNAPDDADMEIQLDAQISDGTSSVATPENEPDDQPKTPRKSSPNPLRVATHAVVESLRKPVQIHWKPVRYEHHNQGWRIVLEWESSSSTASYVVFARRSCGTWYRHKTIADGQNSCEIDWKKGEPEAGFSFMVQCKEKFDDPSTLSKVLGPVVAPAAPGPVRQVAVAEVAPCMLEVSWKPPAEPPANCGGHSSQVLDYEVLLENELQQQSLTVSKTCQATICDVDPNHCYTIQVCAVNELGRRGPYCIAPCSVEVRRVYTPTLPLDFCAARAWSRRKAPIPPQWRCWWPFDIIVCIIASLAPIACDMELAVSLYCEAGDPLLMSILFSVYYVFGAVATYLAEMVEAISPPAITAFFAKILFCVSTLVFHLYVSYIRSGRSIEIAEERPFWSFERKAYKEIIELRDGLPSTSILTQEALLLILCRALAGASASALRQLTLHVFLPSETLSKSNRRWLSFCVSFVLSKCAPLGLVALAVLLAGGFDIDEAIYGLTRCLVLVVLASAFGGLVFGPHASRPEAAVSLFRVSTPAVLRRYICLCEAELRKAIDQLLNKEHWSNAAEMRGCLLSWEGANKPLWMWSLRSVSLLDDQAPLLGLPDASILTAMAALLRKQFLGAEDDIIECLEIARSRILKGKQQRLSTAAYRLVLDVLCIGATLMEPEQEQGHKDVAVSMNSRRKPGTLSYSVADLHDALSHVHTVSHLAIPCPELATSYVVSRTSRHTWLSRLGCSCCCTASDLNQRLAIDRAVHMLQLQDCQDTRNSEATESTLTRSLTANWSGACPKWADIIAPRRENFMLRAFDKKYEELAVAIYQLSIRAEVQQDAKETKRSSALKEPTDLRDFREKYERQFGKFSASSESDDAEISATFAPTIYNFVKEIMVPTIPPGSKEDKWKPSVAYALVCLMRRTDTSRVNDYLDLGLDSLAARLLRDFTWRKGQGDQRGAPRDRAKKFIKAYLRVRFFGVRKWTARVAYDVYTLARECQTIRNDGRSSLTAEEEAECLASVHSLQNLYSFPDYSNPKDFFTVTFQPGQNGMSVDGEQGKVFSVAESAQAHQDGVKVGMQIVEINRREFSKDLLTSLEQGEHAYQVTFTKSIVACDAMPELISMCRGVVDQLTTVFGKLLDDDGSPEVVANRLTEITKWIDYHCAELYRRLGGSGVHMCDQRETHSGVETLLAAVALGFEKVEELNIVAEGCNVLALHLGLRSPNSRGELAKCPPLGVCLGAMLNLCHAISAPFESLQPQDDLPACLLESLHMSLSDDFNWQPFVDLVEKGDACKFLAAIAAGGGIEAEVAWSPTVRRTSQDAETAQMLILLFLRMVRSGSVPPPLPPNPSDLPKDEDYIEWVLRYLGCRGDGLLNMEDAFLMINAIKGPESHCDLTMYNEFCSFRETSPSVGLTLEDARFLLQQFNSKDSASNPARTLYHDFELAIGGYGRGYIQHSERRRHAVEVNVQSSSLAAWGISDTLGLWLTHFFGPQNTKATATKLISSQPSHSCLSCFGCCSKTKQDIGLKNVRTSELRGILALQNRPHELARAWRAAAVQGAISAAPWRRARGDGLSRIVNSNRAGNKRIQQILPYTEQAEIQTNTDSASGFDVNSKMRKFQTDFCHSPTVMWKGGLRRDELRHLAAIKVYRRNWLVHTFALHRWGCNSHVWPAMVSTCILAVVEAGMFSLLPQFFRIKHRDLGMSIAGAAGAAAGILSCLVFGQALGALHLEFRLRNMKDCTLPVSREHMQASKQAWESDCLAMSICVNLAVICYTCVWLPWISFPECLPLLFVAALLLGISRPLLELPFWLQPRKSHNDGRINTLDLNKAFAFRSVLVAFFFPYFVWFSDTDDEARISYWDFLHRNIPVVFAEWQKWIELADNEYGHMGSFFASLNSFLVVLALLPLVSWHSSALRKRAYSHPVRRALHFKAPQRSMARGGPPVDARPIIIRAGAQRLFVQWMSLRSTRDLVYDAQISEDFGRWGPADDFGRTFGSKERIQWPADPRVPRCYIPVGLIRPGVTIRIRVRCAPASSDSFKRKFQERKEMLIWGPWSQHSLLIHRPSELRVNLVLRPFIHLLCTPMYLLDTLLVTIPEAWLVQVFHPSSWMRVLRFIVLFALWPFVILHCVFWILPEAIIRTCRNTRRLRCLLIGPLLLGTPFLLVYALLFLCHKFLRTWDRTRNVEALPVVEDFGPVLDLKPRWLGGAKDRYAQPGLHGVKSDLSCQIWPKTSESSRFLFLEKERNKLKLTIIMGEKGPLHITCDLENCPHSLMLEKCIGSRLEKLGSCLGNSGDVGTLPSESAKRGWIPRRRVQGDKIYFVASDIVNHLLDVRAFVDKMIQQGATALIFENSSAGSLPISTSWSQDPPDVTTRHSGCGDALDIPFFFVNDRIAEQLQEAMEPGTASFVKGIGLCVEDVYFQELEATWKPTGLYTDRVNDRSSIIVLQHRSISFSKNEEFGEDSWTTCAIVDPAAGLVRCTAPRTAEGVQFRLLGDAQNAWQPLTPFIELNEVAQPTEPTPVVQKQVETSCEPEILRLARRQPNSPTKPRDADQSSNLPELEEQDPKLQLKKVGTRTLRTARLAAQKLTAATAGKSTQMTQVASEEDVTVSLAQTRTQVSPQSTIEQMRDSDQALQRTLLSTRPCDSVADTMLDINKAPSGHGTPPRYESHAPVRAQAQAFWGNFNKKVVPRFNNLDWLG